MAIVPGTDRVVSVTWLVRLEAGDDYGPEEVSFVDEEEALDFAVKHDATPVRCVSYGWGAPYDIRGAWLPTLQSFEGEGQ